MTDPPLPPPATAPPDRNDENLSVASPPAEPGLAERWGEKILSILDFFSRPAAALLSRREAVLQGFGAAVGRVLLAAVLISLCVTLGTVIQYSAEWIGDLLRFENSGGRGSLVAVWVLAAGGTAMVCFIDPDKKWRILNWLLFAMVGAFTIGGYGPLLLQWSILAGLFGISWMIHCALQQRDRQDEWELQLQRAGQTVHPKPSPDLLKRYEGLAGLRDKTAGDCSERHN
jgi:hypothetical protein